MHVYEERVQPTDLRHIRGTHEWGTRNNLQRELAYNDCADFDMSVPMCHCKCIISYICDLYLVGLYKIKMQSQSHVLVVCHNKTSTIILQE